MTENGGGELLQLIEDVGNLAAATTSGVSDVLRDAAKLLLARLGQLVVIAVREPDGGLRVEVGHVDAARQEQAVRLLQQALPGLRRLAGNTRREFRWIPRVSRTHLELACGGEHEVVDAIEQLQTTSMMVVAVQDSGRNIGVVGVASTEENARYDAQQLAALQVIGRRLAVAVEGARLRATLQAVSHSHMRLEGALRKWTRVFDLASWGAALVDPQTRRLEAANEAFARMHGYHRADELIGRMFAGLLPAERLEEPTRWPEAADSPGCTYESLHRRADGRTFPVLVSVTRLDIDREPETFVVMVQDLTDLKRAEERLRRAQRMEAVGRLAGGVAHEVNNMMTIILGFSDLLSRAEELPGTLQADVEEIRKAAARAGKITQQLLAFSRQQVLQPTELKLNGVVEELVPVLRLLVPANIRVETALSPLDATVRADRAQLEQVLINLAFNARDAMPEGGIIRITTEGRYLSGDAGQRLIGVPFAPGQYGLISVVDTGHGMEESTLAQLFEPFFTTKPAGSGTGLGLATVYGIVKQSGGYVWAESTPGDGTTFTVGLPLVPTAMAHQRASGQHPQAYESPGGTVLVVEDEPGVRQLAARVLGGRGYQVLEARNGAEALATMERAGEDVHLVLTDVVVPDLGTGELARRVRDVRDEVPILYMSGYPREEVLQRGLIRADQPFLQKPFTGDGLVQAVDRILSNPVVGR